MLVDYILFLTADVTVTPNLNEIQNYKYVSKEELNLMFDDPGRGLHDLNAIASHTIDIANSFTPWFKLIARDFLFGWWEELFKRKGADGRVVAKNLVGIADGSKVFRMT